MAKSKNTLPEILVRKNLYKKGIRFRLHSSELPGTPDIIIRKKKLAVFVHGCYWHGHECCRNRHSRNMSKHWRRKIEAQKQRDEQNAKALITIGWTPIVLWECEIEKNVSAATEFLDWIVKKQA